MKKEDLIGIGIIVQGMNGRKIVDFIESFGFRNPSYNGTGSNGSLYGIRKGYDTLSCLSKNETHKFDKIMTLEEAEEYKKDNVNNNYSIY